MLICGALGAAYGCRETLCASDLKFFHCLAGQLHDRTTDGVCLVVDTVYRDVDVATALFR